MKSGLLNVCNLNTVLMLVILGLVVYCCVRQKRENFNYGLNFSILPRNDNGIFDPDSNAIAGYPSQVQYSGEGINNLLKNDETRGMSEEDIKKLVEKRLKETQNERYSEEKDRRNLLLDQYLDDEKEYINEFIKDKGNNAPDYDNVEAGLRSNNKEVRGVYENAPDFPNWPVMSGLNDITDVKGMNFSPYSNE